MGQHLHNPVAIKAKNRTIPPKQKSKHVTKTEMRRLGMTLGLALPGIMADAVMKKYR